MTYGIDVVEDVACTDRGGEVTVVNIFGEGQPESIEQFSADASTDVGPPDTRDCRDAHQRAMLHFGRLGFVEPQWEQHRTCGRFAGLDLGHVGADQELASGLRLIAARGDKPDVGSVDHVSHDGVL